jgi:hypothetical protein
LAAELRLEPYVVLALAGGGGGERIHGQRDDDGQQGHTEGDLPGQAQPVPRCEGVPGAHVTTSMLVRLQFRGVQDAREPEPSGKTSRIGPPWS